MSVIKIINIIPILYVFYVIPDVLLSKVYSENSAQALNDQEWQWIRTQQLYPSIPKQRMLIRYFQSTGWDVVILVDTPGEDQEEPEDEQDEEEGDELTVTEEDDEEL